MVRTTLSLATTWNLPHELIGTLILAALTGLPNLYTAVHLAQQHEGPAMVSEASNSNTLNILIGIGLTALVFSLGSAGGILDLELGWLIGLTLLALILAYWKRGITRAGGLGLIGFYLLFVGIRAYLTLGHG